VLPSPLHDQHAIVTGGGRGIGAAIAGELARLGARVTIMGRDRARLDATAERLSTAHGVRVRAVRCDVADPHAIAGAFGEARGELGEVTILVNNAGIAEAAPLVETTRELWDRHFAVNVTGALLCAQQVLPPMLARRAGRIVNVASTAGLRGVPHAGAYSASKHALIGLTRTLALETAKHGVTVNAVCPGYTDTGMAQVAIANLVRHRGKTPEEAREAIVRTVPRGSLIRPEEVAATVAWLCTPAASAVTGQAIVIAGGDVV
jgi:NAD(P)-dependent dehydrogenase (short-subunit alcohol dehydrogenase family)